MKNYTFAKRLGFIFYQNKSKFDGWQNIETEFNQAVNSFVSSLALFRVNADRFLNEQDSRRLPKDEEEINELFRKVCEFKHSCSEFALQYCDLEDYFLNLYRGKYEELNSENSELMQIFLSEYFNYTLILTYSHVLNSLETRIDRLKDKVEKQKFKYIEKQP